MNYVEQVIAAVEASGKVVWSVFAACVAALAAEHYFPERFEGLPDWVLPVLLLAAIFTGVLSIAAVTPPILKGIRWISKLALAPIRKRQVTKNLLALSLEELTVLSKALCEGERRIKIKPDLEATIRLQDKGLIERTPGNTTFSGGKRIFLIPPDVWRIMLELDSFRIANKVNLLRLMERELSPKAMLPDLPQAHPAVRKR